MLETIMQLDSRGIVPFGNESAENYARRGAATLTGAMQLKVEYPLGQEAHILGKTTMYNAKRVIMPPGAAAEMKEKFRADISWIPVFEAELGFHSHIAGEAADLYRNGQSIPALICCEATKQTLLHEAMHAVRGFADYANNKAFEEAVADEGRFTIQGFNAVFARWRNALIVRAARKRLEDCTGENAGYVLLRLTKPEMMALTRAGNPVGYLRDLSCLRHRIIKERLGL